MVADGSEAPLLGVRSFCVLLALAEEARHGYAITKAVEAMTDGEIRVTAGSLYPIVRQMQIDGWIVEVAGDGQDARRKKYTLTPRGRRIAQAEARRLDSLVRLARSFKLLPSGVTA